MFFLAGSIILTSYLTLSFKIVERYRIPVLQAIVFNYFTCVITGSLVNRSFPVMNTATQEPWFLWSLLTGTMFVVLFNVIGFTAQKIGVAVASVANKLSLVIPFVFSLYLYNEQSSSMKIAGIVAALAAVVLTCLPGKKKNNDQGPKVSMMIRVILPAFLFLGSGLLDTTVKYVEQEFLNDQNSNAYLITSFLTAGCIGGAVLLILLFIRKQKFEPKSILAGIAIGVPNYFSIWCLVEVLRLFPGRSSAIIPVNNMGIVLFSAIMAAVLFREKLSGLNRVGIALSIAAIALIAYG